MDYVKSFFTKENKDEKKELNKKLSEIKLTGELYLKRIGENEKLLSDDCILSMLLLDIANYEYSLIASNNNYLGDQEEWKDIEFYINNDLHLKLIKSNGLNNLIWEKEKIFYCFKVLKDESNKANITNFIQNLCNFIYSNEMEVKFDSVKAEESISYISVLGENNNIFAFLENQFNFYSQNSEINNNSINQKSTKNEFDFSKLDSNAIIFSQSGVLLIYRKEFDDLNIVSKNCLFLIIKLTNFESILAIIDLSEGKNTLLVKNEIVTSFVIQGNISQNYVMWISKSENNNVDSVFNFIFNEKGHLEKLNVVINKCLYASNCGNDDLKDDERDLIETVNQMEIDDDSSIESYKDRYAEEGVEEGNMFSVQSYLHPKTYTVTNDHKLMVYKQGSEGELKLDNIVKSIVSNHYNINKPDKAKMYLNDSHILFQENGNLFDFDLNKQQIVQEYNFSNNGLVDFSLPHKYDQMDVNQLIIGIDKLSLMTLDPRINSNNRIVNNRTYAKGTQTNFKEIKTTSDGNIVIGSLDGKIRLFKGNYNSKSKAGTLIPTFGDAIKSIDVSNKGEYILLTFNSYLMLISTSMTSDSGQEYDGFSTSIAKHLKTIKLQLSPIDIQKFDLINSGYNNAKFNVGKDLKESIIACTIGPVLVNWDLRKVLKGNLKSYRVFEKETNLLSNEFIYNDTEQIYTATNLVGIQHK